MAICLTPSSPRGWGHLKTLVTQMVDPGLLVITQDRPEQLQTPRGVGITQSVV
jgi:hypothetical protein